LTREDTKQEESNIRQKSIGPFEEVCCWRENWRETDRCIWHAEIDNKPIEPLIKSRTDNPERFDGVSLTGTVLGDMISFEDCIINYSSFDGSYLEHANFRGVRARHVSFKNCMLSYAELTNCSIHFSNFSESDMQIVSGVEMNLSKCDFSKTILDGDFRHSDIWHCKFTESEKGPTDLTGARVIGSDFSNSLMSGWKWTFANGSHNDFNKCMIRDSHWSYASMKKSDFSKADLRECTLFSTDLENSDFSESSMTKCNFSESDLYACLFQNVRIDRESVFGNHYSRAKRPSLNVDDIIDINELWNNHTTSRGKEDRIQLIEKRIWTYQTVQNVFELNSITDQARKLYLLRKNAQREQISLAGKWTNIDWYLSTGSKYVTGFGERPLRVIFWSICTVFLFPLIYMSTGGVEGARLLLAFDSRQVDFIPIVQLVSDYLTSLYFSGMTFSTLGYGDLQPATWTVRLFATVESFIGALLTALLVFVLGRRTTW